MYMMPEIICVIFICALSLLCHLIIGSKVKKVEAENISIKEELEGFCREKKMNVQIEISDEVQSACYIYDEKKICLKEGTSLAHVATAYHEFGHAIDDHVRGKQIEYKWYHHVMYNIFKYSLVLAIVLYIVQKGLYLENLILAILTGISLVLSVWFAVQNLKDEVIANQYAMKIMKERNVFTDSQFPLVKLTLFSGMQSYIIVFILSIMMVTFFVHYVVSVFI